MCSLLKNTCIAIHYIINIIFPFLKVVVMAGIEIGTLLAQTAIRMMTDTRMTIDITDQIVILTIVTRQTLTTGTQMTDTLTIDTLQALD